MLRRIGAPLGDLQLQVLFLVPATLLRPYMFAQALTVLWFARNSAFCPENYYRAL